MVVIGCWKRKGKHAKHQDVEKAKPHNKYPRKLEPLKNGTKSKTEPSKNEISPKPSQNGTAPKPKTKIDATNDKNDNRMAFTSKVGPLDLPALKSERKEERRKLGKKEQAKAKANIYSAKKETSETPVVEFKF